MGTEAEQDGRSMGGVVGTGCAEPGARPSHPTLSGQAQRGPLCSTDPQTAADNV